MAEQERSQGAQQQRIQCHFVSNTHWDREWKYSAQRARYMLVHMMDLLLEILETEPDYHHFHLDSQTLPVLDYLAVRPEREDDIRCHVKAGRLAIGPWFCLPDEFCVSGESLVRNLLMGHQIAGRYGGVTKTGYSPFSWGQISQMPQIYKGFGIEMMMFYRGVNTIVAPRSEFIWEGPDGTRIVASRLGKRPRYNVWYVLQRPAYWGAKPDALNDFRMCWADGHAPFRLISGEGSKLDYQVAHPAYCYDQSVFPLCAEQAIAEQDGDWSTPHRLWSAGHDSSSPDTRELRMIKDAQEALRDWADVFHSTMKGFQDQVLAHRRDDWPIVKGEMRHTYTAGSTSSLLGWVISARTFLKQDNFRTETLLTGLAEPLAAFSALWTGRHDTPLIQAAYEWLLQNHCHDSIGGCGRDVVSDDMTYRFRQAREISLCVLEDAMKQVGGSLDIGDWDKNDIALIAYNPTLMARTDVVGVLLDIPAEWGGGGFEIFDHDGKPVEYQMESRQSPFYETVYAPNDVFTYLEVVRHDLRLLVENVPGMGYRTLRVRRTDKRYGNPPVSLVRDERTMENEYVVVHINDNGTLDVQDKISGRTFAGQGYFRDSGACGNAWLHEAPECDHELTTRDAKAVVSVERAGHLEASLRVVINWPLPKSLSADGRRRSAQLTALCIVNTVTLRRGQRWVEVVTELDNAVEDHYLRVSFPSNVATDVIMAHSPFDVVERAIAAPDASQFDDVPQAEQPMGSFVDLSGVDWGLAILNDGLKAYEAHDDIERTVSLTLLRCFAMRFFVPEKLDHPELASTTQCPGVHRFRYAIMPHEGDWQKGRVWSAADAFSRQLQMAQIAPTTHGKKPLEGRFLEATPDTLHISAVKRSENEQGWVVRLFNPGDDTIEASVRFNGGRAGVAKALSPTENVRCEFALPNEVERAWTLVREVTLEEIPIRELAIDEAGCVRIQLTKKKIVTLEFVG